MGWIEKLKDRWQVKNAFQVVSILIVFVCTGFSVLLIKRPFFTLWFPDGNIPAEARILYWIFVLPVYNALLLFYGFIFGQFHFFWNFEKRFLKKIFSIFK